MTQMSDSQMECQMFKGLQRPLEFMGLQGRYITWAGITAAVAILGFMLVYALLGFLLALVFAAVTITVGIALILVKRPGAFTQRKSAGGCMYSPAVSACNHKDCMMLKLQHC